MPRDEDDDDAGSWEDDGSRGLHGVRAPAAEYWSDEEDRAGGPRLAEGGDAGAEPRDTSAQGPWGALTQRRLGGPRVEEPVTSALLSRLLLYALTYSACLTGCEVLTMWASRRVGGALQLGLLSGTLWGAVRCACLMGLPFSLLCGYGLLKHPAVWKEMIPPRRKVLNEMCSGRIVFRHVCMLEDTQQLAQACVTHSISLLQRTLPEFVWRVELVCEGLPFWEPPAAAHVIAVPPEYSSPNGTQGRARALHYASQHSTAIAGDWIVYLGAASVDAILAHVVDEAYRLSAAREQHDRHASKYGRVAQGPMCIGQTGGSWTGFLSDTRRVGEAYGMTRFQYECSEAWAGVQHSYLVVPKELEQAVGFDHGPRVNGADLTLFALLCRDTGARFVWLDAPTEEPASLGAGDFSMCRHRAMASRLSTFAAAGGSASGALSVDRRVPLALLTGSASFAQLCLVVTALSVVIQHQVSVAELLVSFAISFCSGTVLFCYVLGLASSCSPLSFGGGPAGWVVFGVLMFAQVLWAPVACFLELLAHAQALHEHWRS